MDEKLSKEVAFFASEVKRLRKLLRETQRCFKDINDGADTLLRAEIRPEEEFIRTVTTKPPCIVVFGSSNPAKASVVNKIFNKPVLPILWNEQGLIPWRTVRFKHGSKTSISLSILGSYELLDDEVTPQHLNWNTVPTENLQIRHSYSHEKHKDLAHTCAILDIKMKNHLLSEGCELVVAQGFEGKESLEEVYRKCTCDGLPILVYAVDKAVFSKQEINHLKQLKVLDPNISIFFVRVPKPGLEINGFKNGHRNNNPQPPTSPLDKIRETLAKNNISSSYCKDDREAWSLRSLSGRNSSSAPTSPSKQSNRNTNTESQVEAANASPNTNSPVKSKDCNSQFPINPSINVNGTTKCDQTELPVQSNGTKSHGQGDGINEVIQSNNNNVPVPVGSGIMNGYVHSESQSKPSQPKTKCTALDSSTRILEVLGYSSIKISRYLPCTEHKKASCRECILQDSMTAETDSVRKSSVDVVRPSSCSDIDVIDSDSDYEYDRSVDTQVAAGGPTAVRPTNNNNNWHKPLVAANRNCSTMSLAGDDVHREYALSLFQQLVDCKYLDLLPTVRNLSEDLENSLREVYHSELAECFENLSNFLQFVRLQLQRILTNAVTLLNVVHSRSLHSFILKAFDMARDMQVTPRKLEYARKKERELFKSLLGISDQKQDEIRLMIADTVEHLRETLLNKAEEYEFIGVDIPDSGNVQCARDLKICTGQIQALVLENLNSTIATKLLDSMHILKDSYTGVLSRCLESLEKSDSLSDESVRTTLALREILNSAYQVQITVNAGSSLIRMLYEKMKQLMNAMAWRNLAHIDNAWKRKVATDMLQSLNECRLARSICAQIKERLKQSHESFESAMEHLQTHHSGRLVRTEEQRLKVRKVHAPRVAKLALESISMKDYIVHGMPPLGPEIGRGQYGVVYSCDKWAGIGPCAIKSVVPPDEKHWNDLALEFYYTKNVPEHERIVALRGSVIDYTYGGGSSPAVLLIMDRFQRDLYAALKSNLDWLARLQVAIDVVEGIRFLHSQGLVHRDIKLKNVLVGLQ